MEILQAIVLGIIEGLTEFLPVSSTGHLIVAERAMGFKDQAELFTVFIQLGAIAAVLWFYRNDIANKLARLFKGEARAVKFWLNLVIATLPAGLVGLLFDSTLQRYVRPVTVATAMIGGGIILLLVETALDPKRRPSKQAEGKPVEHGETSIEHITAKQALGIGVAQIVSLIPGTSRSAATIVGGLLAGLDRVTATAFSFYLAIPVIILASGYKLVTQWDNVGRLPGGAAALAAGTAAAFVTGLLAVAWLLGYIARHDFKPFAYYRLAAGGLIILLVLLGVMDNTL
jgi:undecaprenyl-diphosphatase